MAIARGGSGGMAVVVCVDGGRLRSSNLFPSVYFFLDLYGWVKLFVGSHSYQRHPLPLNSRKKLFFSMVEAHLRI